MSSIFNRGCLAALLGLLVSHVAVAQIVADSSIAGKLNGEASRLGRKGGIPGLAYLVYSQGRTYMGTLGFSDEASGAVVTETTQFELGSCSKAFTGLAILRLEKEGLLSLDSSITSY